MGADMVISVSTFLERIGTDRERKKDRHFAYHMSMWAWRRKWRAAKEANDYEAMDFLDRQLEVLNAI